MYIITIMIPWIEVSSLQSHNCDCKDEISGHETDNCNDIQLASFMYFYKPDDDSIRSKHVAFLYENNICFIYKQILLLYCSFILCKCC